MPYQCNTSPTPPQNHRDAGHGARERVCTGQVAHPESGLEQVKLFFTDKESHRWTGQPFINHLKINFMATESQNVVSADRIKTDPAFERTRENMAEFTRATKAAGLLRSIFREMLINASDKITQGRLCKVFSRIITTDPINARGERTVNKGDLLQVQRFNFNKRAGLSDTLYVRCLAGVDRATGQVVVTIPSFVPRIMVQAPRGTSHFRIVAAATAVDFDNETYEHAQQATTELPWDHVPTAASSLTMALPANSPHAIVVVLGIEFYQRVNARMYALKSGEFNAASVVKVDIPPAQAQGV